MPPEPPASPHAATQTSVPSVCSTPTQSDPPDVRDASTVTAAAAAVTACSQTPPPPALQSVSQQTAGPARRSIGHQARPVLRTVAAGTEPLPRRTVGLQTAQAPWRHACVQVAPETREAAVGCSPPELESTETQTDGDLVALMGELVDRATDQQCLQLMRNKVALRRAASKLFELLVESAGEGEVLARSAGEGEV